MDSNTQKSIQELQSYEQVLQNILMQKQSIQLELNEVNNAVAELSNYKGDVYRVLGGIMLKVDAEKTKKELAENKNNLSLHISSFEKQEKDISEKSNKLKKDINEAMSRGQK
ncbi:MAG: prefoldin subunit beta [Nanoarchaeota archaeon]